jgi:hypothetical protein
MRKFISTILLIILSTIAFAQDGHIIYNDHSNYKMYGRGVLVRSDAANLDTLTSVYDGTIAFDTLSRTFKGYDGDGFHSLAFGEVRDTVISLSSADILALSGTPKTVVPAPGSGKLLQVLAATVKYTFGTAAYVSGTSLRVGTVLGQDAYICKVLDATVNSIRTFQPYDHSASPSGYTGSTENTAITIDSNTTATTGDGTAKVWVRYQIIEF